MSSSTAQLLAFILYFAVVLGIGVYFFLKTRGGSERDYFLGGRGMNPWVTAMSAQASDMSAWLLMGLPGSILAAGMGQVWIAIGLLIGTYFNWLYTAPRLRKFSKAANDAITLPEYLSSRFLTKSPALRAIAAIVFLFSFTIYTATSFKACGTLFNTIFGLDPKIATLIAAAIIFAYTFLGGYAAVCWTDLIQGILMLVALLIVPIMAYAFCSSEGLFSAASTPDNYWNFLSGGSANWKSISDILSGLAWGLGYFGMPHILVRFMSIKTPAMIKTSRRIAMTWVVLALGAACAVGLIGRVYLPELAAESADPATVFIVSCTKLFPAFIAGIFLSGILAASMSTADSQLLVSASAFASDLYKPLIRKQAKSKEMLLVSRLIVVLVSIIAYLVAINPSSGTIMSLVSNAWGVFGSAFGPVILFSLFWKRFNVQGAIAGIIVGAVVDVVWMVALTGPTGIYELLPGFILGFLAAYFVAKFTPAPSAEVAELYDRAVKTED